MVELKKNIKGEIQLGRKASLLVVFIWGLIMLFCTYLLMTKMGWLDIEETTTISCANGDIEIYNGTGVYCGIWVESIEELEKEITSPNNPEINLDIQSIG